MSDVLEAFNQSLFLCLNADSSTPTWLIECAILIAKYTALIVPLMAIILWCWGHQTSRALVIKMILVAMLGSLFSYLLGLLYPHPRPFTVGVGTNFLYHAPNASFPSNHGTAFFCVTLTWLMSNVRSWSAWVMLLLSVMVAWSRIFLGIHFPFDMLGAFATACLSLIIVHRVLKRRNMGIKITLSLEKRYRTLFSKPIAWGWIK